MDQAVPSGSRKKQKLDNATKIILTDGELIFDSSGGSLLNVIQEKYHIGDSKTFDASVGCYTFIGEIGTIMNGQSGSQLPPGRRNYYDDFNVILPNVATVSCTDGTFSFTCEPSNGEMCDLLSDVYTQFRIAFNEHKVLNELKVSCSDFIKMVSRDLLNSSASSGEHPMPADISPNNSNSPPVADDVGFYGIIPKTVPSVFTEQQQNYATFEPERDEAQLESTPVSNVPMEERIEGVKLICGLLRRLNKGRDTIAAIKEQLNNVLDVESTL